MTTCRQDAAQWLITNETDGQKMIEKKERKEGEPSPLTPSLFRVFALRLFCRSGSPWPPLIHSISPPDEQERRTEERTKKLGRQVPKERKAKLHVGEGFLSSLFVIHAFPPKKSPNASGVNAPDRQSESQPSNLPFRWWPIAGCRGCV